MASEQAPTRAAVVELKAERIIVEEAYDFLDEKRLLLAAELLKQLADYEKLRAELESLNEKARAAMAAAVKHHGLEGLSVYPVAPCAQVLESRQRNLMGVVLMETELAGTATPGDGAGAPSHPSTAAEQCKPVFQQLLKLAGVLAGVSGNLQRLFLEYRSTERRARALENVILPEIENSLKRMSTYLEEIDLEDAIRARPLAK